jgi:hypothetical protein
VKITGNKDREDKNVTNPSVSFTCINAISHLQKPWAEKALATRNGNWAMKGNQAVAEMDPWAEFIHLKKNFRKAESYLFEFDRKSKKDKPTRCNYRGLFKPQRHLYTKWRIMKKAAAVIDEGLSYAQPLNAVDQISSLYLNFG